MSDRNFLVLLYDDVSYEWHVWPGYELLSFEEAKHIIDRKMHIGTVIEGAEQKLSLAYVGNSKMRVSFDDLRLFEEPDAEKKIIKKLAGGE